MAERRYPRTVDEIFEDFKGRRAGIIKALTSDVDEFYQQCDPEGENLCLYGHPTGKWEVNLPAEEVPPELPEPALGINFSRDGMQEKEWLSLIAAHSDSWLISIAVYFGTRYGFHKAERKRLFDMINELPTVSEVVSGACRKENASIPNSSSKSKMNSKPRKLSKPQLEDGEEESNDEEEEEEEDKHGETLCGACGNYSASDDFWICCDVCEKWYHGKCVNITPAKADRIKRYKCPACSN